MTPVRIAFLIPAYTDADHLRRLMDSLPAHSHFYIHIDKKSDITSFLPLAQREDVRLVEPRIDVQWGGISQVEYQMTLFRAALSAGVHYDFLCTLSGMEYPVWSNEHIVDFFSRHRGQSILQGICMEHQGRAADKYRIYYPLADRPWGRGTWRNRLRVALRWLVRPFLRKPLTFCADGRKYTLHKGSDWFAVTPELASYALDIWETSPQLRKYFKTSFIPSETVLHTIAFNSPMASSCMLVEGPYTSLANLTPLIYIDYHPLVKILTAEDYQSVIDSGKMFCRKVVTGRSDSLVEMLECRRRQSGV